MIKPFNARVIKENHPDLTVVIPVSGGRKSQLLIKEAAKKHGAKNVIGIFASNDWEHPFTYTHIETFLEKYGVTVYNVSSGSLFDKIKEKESFSFVRRRHCKRDLKTKPLKAAYTQLSKQYTKNGGFEIWLTTNNTVEFAEDGTEISPDEVYEPHELRACPTSLAKRGVMLRLPLILTSDNEIKKKMEQEENPLYKLGFKPGCFPCLKSNQSHHQNCFNSGSFGQSQRIKVERLEHTLNERHKAANTEQLTIPFKGEGMA